MRTFRSERYDIVCGAQACDSGLFRAVLVISKNTWPSRPRNIAVIAERHVSADLAVESAHAQGLEWVKNFG